MAEKAALDYAAELIAFHYDCECGSRITTKSTRGRPGLRLVCRRCRKANFLSELEAVTINAELNEALRLVALQLDVESRDFAMPKGRADRPLERATPKGYPVGLVGESFYQPAIKRCYPGDRVTLAPEPTNPHDSKAIAVLSKHGEKLGYIPKDSFVQRLIHEEGSPCSACILNLIADGPMTGVVIDVEPG